MDNGCEAEIYPEFTLLEWLFNIGLTLDMWNGTITDCVEYKMHYKIPSSIKV